MTRGFFVLALWAGCGGVEIPVPTTIDATRSGIELQRLERGRALYLEKCTGCHDPYGPREVPTEHWPGHVANMEERAEITLEEKEIIVQYLVTVSQN